MPIYDFVCSQGHVTEALQPYDAATPECPICTSATVRRPTSCALGGVASPGPSREQMPQTWRGTYGADTEYVAHLRRQWDKRRDLEARYPDLKGDDRPIIAHEGQYHQAPLRVGDTPMGIHRSSGTTEAATRP